MSREHGAGAEQAPGGGLAFSPTGPSGETGGQSTRGRRVPGEI